MAGLEGGSGGGRGIEADPCSCQAGAQINAAVTVRLPVPVAVVLVAAAKIERTVENGAGNRTGVSAVNRHVAWVIGIAAGEREGAGAVLVEHAGAGQFAGDSDSCSRRQPGTGRSNVNNSTRCDRYRSTTQGCAQRCLRCCQAAECCLRKYSFRPRCCWSL